jgi:hypothetical protein
MKITPAELCENGYVLIDRLVHKELIPFIQKYIKTKTRYSILYVVCNIMIMAWIVFWFLRFSDIKDNPLNFAYAHFFLGLVLALLLVPIHEFIHVLAYKSQGAVSTSYDANLKKLYFLAIADQFVANALEFQIIALAPFVVVSSILLLLLIFVPLLWSFTILGLLFMHTSFCSGDFGLLSYFEHHKDKEMVTYDDKTYGISYFYGKAKLL